MAQHDMVIANQGFPAFRSDLNNALAALASTNKGTAVPTSPFAGQLWVDDNTPSATAWTLNMHDGTDDIELMRIDTTNNYSYFNNLLIGASLPATQDGILHIHSASAGAVSAHANGDELVLENSGVVGMTLLSPDAQQSFVYFGVPADNRYASISTLGPTNGSTAFGMIFTVNGHNWWMSKDGGFVIDPGGALGSTSNDGILHVHKGSAGAVTAQANSNLVIESSTVNQIEMLAPDASAQGILFTNLSGQAASISAEYNATAERLAISVPASQRLVIHDTGQIALGAGMGAWQAADGQLHVFNNSAGAVTAHDDADEVVVESNITGGMGLSLLCPDAGSTGFVMGYPTSNSRHSILGYGPSHATLADAMVIKVSGQNRMTHRSGVWTIIAPTVTTFTNANMAVGLTINQGGEDNEAFALKSSDIAHGLASQGHETDTYFAIQKSDADSGGFIITGVCEDPGHAFPFLLNCFGGTPSTAAGTTSNAGIACQWWQHDGANAVENVTANTLVFGVKKGEAAGTSRALFFVDAEGDLHNDGVASLGTFDEWDDAELVRAFDIYRSPADVIRSEWDEFVRYNVDDLKRARILGDPPEGDPLVNVTQLQRLHNGAIWQTHCGVQELRGEVRGLRERLAIAEQSLEKLIAIENHQA
jgi:hypothetical protein